MSAQPYTAVGGGLVLAVRLTPRGGRDAFEGVATAADGRRHIKARVRAAPEDGKANMALIALLAKTLDMPKAAIKLESGVTSRLKRLHIAGDAEALAARLERICERFT